MFLSLRTATSLILIDSTQLTSLLTTSVFVLTLVILLAVLTHWEPKDIIGVTAAFAAVLVVFVAHLLLVASVEMVELANR